MDTSGRRYDGRVGPSFVALTRQTADAAVVMIEGRLSAASIPACRCAIETALLHHPTRLVLDLCGATCDEASLSVLALIRRFAERHGVPLSLSPGSHAVLDPVDVEQLTDDYPIAVSYAG
jgi:anti-anti-sigma regulatory factor